jgi:hypothetical protein
LVIHSLTSNPDYYSFCHFEGFKIPLEKSFLTSIPDLLEIPHVQLDCTSQIIYYTILLQGIVTKPEALPRRGTLIHILYQKCVSLSEDWLKNIKDTPADFFAALTLVRKPDTFQYHTNELTNSTDVIVPRVLRYRFILESPRPSMQDIQSPRIFLRR